MFSAAGCMFEACRCFRQLRFVFTMSKIICLCKYKEEANQPFCISISVYSGNTVSSLEMSLGMLLLHWKVTLTEVTLTLDIQEKLQGPRSVHNTMKCLHKALCFMC